MASTTQRNKARVAALKLPKLAQTAESVQVERSLERLIDDLEDAVDDLQFDLDAALDDVEQLKKELNWHYKIDVALVVLILLTWCISAIW